MKIGFLTEHLSLRGTEIALFDYAKYNKILLNNESFIIINGNQPEYKNPARNKFINEFNNIYSYKSMSELESIVHTLQLDCIYKICAGYPEPIPSNCKVGIHVVFPAFQPFGNTYVYVSEWLRNYSVPSDSLNNYEFVPHIVELPHNDDNLRSVLGIPIDKLVFGYYGGNDSFDIDFVKQSIKNILTVRNDIYFIFMNIDSFHNHHNIKYLPGTHDLNMKVNFINTCDAMIHARTRGETFGLAIAEFSIKNKPIITYSNSIEQSHLHILKDCAITYNDYNSFYNIIMNFQKPINYTNNSYETFSASKVMEKFKKVFLS
jgi:hypothetical protein